MTTSERVGTPSGDTPPPSGGASSARGLAGIDPHLRRLALVVVLGTIMSILDTTIVNVAIATLARDFHAPLSTVQWVSTGYLLALAMVIPLTITAAISVIIGLYPGFFMRFVHAVL